MHATLRHSMTERPVAAISVCYPVRSFSEAWVLPEGPVPESTTHDAAVAHIKSTLDAWVQRTGRRALVARNLAVRWLANAPQIGVDPDVALIEPAPEERHLRSLRTWEGHAVPRVCFEVVSEDHPYKDYAGIQNRYAAMGAPELIVFDPMLAGPAALGGPVPLQIWRRNAHGTLERVYFGEGPAFSEELKAWLVPAGRTLLICDDSEGCEPWLTEAEQERAEKERERAAREAAERRIAALEAKLSER